jgi:hypothetical protein
MPLNAHVIEPVNISNSKIPPGEPNSLECIANLTLANVIRQLSSLGKHAADVFNEIASDTAKLTERSLVLNQRIENLRRKCAKLDYNKDSSEPLSEAIQIKPFKSVKLLDELLFSRENMSDEMKRLYEKADPPPPLHIFDPHRLLILNYAYFV